MCQIQLLGVALGIAILKTCCFAEYGKEMYHVHSHCSAYQKGVTLDNSQQLSAQQTLRGKLSRVTFRAITTFSDFLLLENVASFERPSKTCNNGVTFRATFAARKVVVATCPV